MHGLGSRGERVRAAAEDCARRFRLEAPAVRRVTDALVTHPALDAQVMTDACRMEAQLHLGPLAQRVVPRFTADELVLPPAQARQFAEIAQAMRSLAARPPPVGNRKGLERERACGSVLRPTRHRQDHGGGGAGGCSRP